MDHNNIVSDMNDFELARALDVLSEMGMIACDLLIESTEYGLKQNEVEMLELFVENTSKAVDLVWCEIIKRHIIAANQARNN